jgi:hypothetical protein
MHEFHIWAFSYKNCQAPGQADSCPHALKERKKEKKPEWMKDKGQSGKVSKCYLVVLLNR